MRLTAAVIFLTLTPVFHCAEYKDYKDYKLYNVQGNNENLKTLNDVLEDYEDSILLLDGTADSAQVLVSPLSSAAFNDLAIERNLKITLVTDDVSEILLSEKGNERARGKYSFKAYHDVSEIQNFVKNISKAYSEVTEVIVAGKSYEGRPVMGIRINTPTGSNKPVFFIESGIHAREWIAPATTTYFVHQLLTSTNPNITRLRDQFDWRIFPTVNPDGYQYSYRYERYWRKTRSRSANGCFGADPNRNWDHNWGQYSSSNRPCDYQTYAGSKPFSEVETRGLRDYLSTIDNLLFYVAFHSYASLLLIPYSDSTDHVHNYEDLIQNFVKNISKAYSEVTEVIVAGKSYEGRPVMGIRINTPTGSNKPVFFIESGIHAREWIAPATTTYFVHQLLTSTNPNITRLRDQFDWRIFPTVNPDGYQYSYRYERYWRKTRSRSANGCFGADPNRNWDHNWGQYSSSNRPCDYQTYAGSKPFSEVETRGLRDYLSTIDNLLFYVAFHSYASLLLIPYSDSTDHVHNYEDLVRVGKVSLEYGKRVANSSYGGPAPAAEVLYKASGGSMDWVYQALGAPLVYTYELRGDSFHWPASRIPEQGEEVTHMMLGLADGANALGYF